MSSRWGDSESLANRATIFFADNPHSSMPLAEKLLENGFIYTCTARADRVLKEVRQQVVSGAAAKAARRTRKCVMVASYLITSLST